MRAGERPRKGPRPAPFGLSVALSAVTLAGCGPEEADHEPLPPVTDAVVGVPGRIALIPGASRASDSAFQNPYTGDAGAVSEGGRLFLWYNCADCHGTLGGGGMGPPLRDESWIYGGDPVSIYRSIMEGRPQGMPGWLDKIPDDQAWKIVAYLQALASGEGPAPSLRPPDDRVPAASGADSLSPTDS